ncbi:catalase [Aureibacter tunicatorum]|uniref:Catalase n=1 Tax=Aureibacter tunicatorum TaxID=866807 RepID=A0AAE4BU84_9BACT|nr:catalase [Aureibacter tunicatorum]MDR6240447.1 catalase [Aureibacter tunicatorum]BDD05674.1 catalase [Aureibacter tunicatorum]
MDKSKLTAQNGAPISDDNNSISVGSRGPLTFDNWQLMEKLAHFNRERIPERIVHARGYGAYGTFRLTKDLSEFSCAKFLQNTGKETPVFARFSTVAGGQDSGDYVRDVRGFALKFYTEEGNWDMVGNNTPVFFLRDPQKFPDFIHSQKKDPKTNLPNPAHHFEFWANNPQSLHQITILMSDRGIPFSLRHINGYSSHTLSLWNDAKKRYWVKWHFKTNQGIKTLNNEQAAQMPAHGMQEDLVQSIQNGDFPTWTVHLQIMPEHEAIDYKINPFDLTKVWPHSDYPLIEIGQLELNRNVGNYFSETEQATFSPANVVPGTGVSPDKMLQARLFAYGDAHRYRVGANHNQLPVNAPQCPVNHYQKDGAMAGMCPYHNNTPNPQNASVNFYPNDRTENGAPAHTPEISEPEMIVNEANIGKYDSRDEDNFSQAGELFRLMTPKQQDFLTGNIADGLSYASPYAQERMISFFQQADPLYGSLVEEKLLNVLETTV